MCDEFSFKSLNTVRQKQIIKNMLNTNEYIKSLKIEVQILTSYDTCIVKLLRKPIEYNFKVLVAEFIFKKFPGTDIYIVSTGTYVVYQNKGIAQELQKVKQYLAKELGVYYILCTTGGWNEKQNHILEKWGWKKISSVISKTTNQENIMWIYEIEKENK